MTVNELTLAYWRRIPSGQLLLWTDLVRESRILVEAALDLLRQDACETPAEKELRIYQSMGVDDTARTEEQEELYGQIKTVKEFCEENEVSLMEHEKGFIIDCVNHTSWEGGTIQFRNYHLPELNMGFVLDRVGERAQLTPPHDYLLPVLNKVREKIGLDQHGGINLNWKQ
jgi:hypothetical protein